MAVSQIPDFEDVEDSKVVETEIVYEGWLFKRGKFANTYKPKWFVLLDNYLLIYYASSGAAKQDGALCDGQISLRDVHKISIIREKGKNNNTTKADAPFISSTYCKVQDVKRSSVIEGIKLAIDHNSEPPKPQSNNSHSSAEDGLSIAVQLETTTRTYTLGSKSLQQFREWVFFLEHMVFGGIIHSGYLQKQGGKWKSWKKRWFHLDRNMSLLHYYETETLKLWKGCIDLADVARIEKGSKESVHNSSGKEFTVELKTTERVWLLACLSAHEQTEWMRKLSQVIREHRQRSRTQQAELTALNQLARHRPSAKSLVKSVSVPAQPQLQRVQSPSATPSLMRDSSLNSMDESPSALAPRRQKHAQSVGIEHLSHAHKATTSIVVPRQKQRGVRFASAATDKSDNEMESSRTATQVHRTASLSQSEVSMSDGGTLVEDPEQSTVIHDEFDVEYEPSVSVKSRSHNIRVHAHKQSLQIPGDGSGGDSHQKRISIVVQSADDNSDTEYYSSSDEDYGGTLDTYDGEANSSLNPLDSDFEEFLQFTQGLGSPPKESGKDHLMPDYADASDPNSGRFGQSSQIAMQAWHDEPSSAEPSPQPPLHQLLTPDSGARLMAPHHVPRKSTGYALKGLKQQFFNVHELDMKTENTELDDMNDEKLEATDDADDSDDERSRMSSMFYSADEVDEMQEAMRHTKTKSVLRLVEFDERFRKILKKKKMDAHDLGQASTRLRTQWHEHLAQAELTEEAILYEEGQERCEEMREDSCVTRVAILLQFYHEWVYNVTAKKEKALSDLLSSLSFFSLALLSNDFYHIKRDYGDQTVYLKLYMLQMTSIEPDMESCVMLLRCNRDKTRMANEPILRRSLYFLSTTKVKGEQESHEVVLQQLLDAIYCFVFYGEYFSANDSHTLYDAINVYEGQKRARNILYKYKNQEQVTNGNKFCSNINYESELAKHDENNKNNCVFGVNMRYGTRLEWYYMHKHRPPNDSMKDELMNHAKYEVSSFQWNDVLLKVQVFKQTFLGLQLRSKRPNEEEAHLCENRQILDVHLIALVFYAQFNKLKKALLNSYHILSAAPIRYHHDGYADQHDKDKDDIQDYTRLKHYRQFFHFGRLVLEAVKVFGENVYASSSRQQAQQGLGLGSVTFYHGVNINYKQVIAWNKLAYHTYGVISVSSKPLISFLYNDNKQSSVLQLDLNGGTLFSEYVYAIDLSFLSDCPYESEVVMDGALSLGIRNILSLRVFKNNGKNQTEYYVWMECIFLMRIMVGDIYWKLDEHLETYFAESLCGNAVLCDRLYDLIINEMEFDPDDTDSNKDIPKFIRRIFHAYCDQFVGYCYVLQTRLACLPQKLQNLFISEKSQCIDCKFLLELLPNTNFIYGYDFIFDDAFCRHVVHFLCDDRQHKNRLMYIQFERFTRQHQNNANCFEQEIVAVCDKYAKQLKQDWNLKKSKKWFCVKFENKQLIDKYTIPINPIKLAPKDKGDKDSKSSTAKKSKKSRSKPKTQTIVITQ